MGKLQFGKYYHIYNRGYNSQNLFQSSENYSHFLELYSKYINPIADTFAWVLLKNHFHLLVRIKELKEIGFYKKLLSGKSDDLNKFQTTCTPTLSEFEGPNKIKVKRPDPSKHFSHLFNAYSKYYNIRFDKSGSLFESPFKRLEVTHEKYFKHLIQYIHTNPVHHGFTDNFKDYPWSSYGTIISIKPTKLSREKVLGWFNDKADFVNFHNKQVDFEFIKNLTLEE